MMRLLPIALSALILGLAACGDSGEDGATAAKPTGTPEPANVAAVDGGGIGDATTADGEDGGAGEEAAPDVGELDDIPPEGVGSGQTQCAAVPESVTAAAAGSVRDATLCLMNAERTSRGLKALKLNAKLGKAANTKAADMVRRRYFAHDTPDGKKFTAAIQAAGYTKGARRWSVGENLGWGSGSRAAPAEMVKSWLGSPPHRANLLSRKWSEVGIGLSLGTPKGGDGATYATEFGKLG